LSGNRVYQDLRISSGLLVIHSESDLGQNYRSTIDFVTQKTGHEGAVSNAVTKA
jgi:hypothetical protein